MSGLCIITVCTLLTAYLLGSIPTGYIAGRLAGTDVRSQGSGNIGATNVLRVLGKRWGIAVFAADALKGLIAVRFALWLVLSKSNWPQYGELFGIFAAAACVAGHSFPVWLRFKGGKGVATSVGALAGIVPIAAATIFIVWLLVFMTSRYVSLASICGALALPVIVAVLVLLEIHGVVLLYFTVAMTALVVWRHRSNITRLRNGTEPRFTRR